MSRLDESTTCINNSEDLFNVEKDQACVVNSSNKNPNKNNPDNKDLQT